MMSLLDPRQIEIVEEVIWLVEHYEAERSPAKGDGYIADVIQAMKSNVGAAPIGERVAMRFIEHLSRDDQIMLNAMMQLGRGDFDTPETFEDLIFACEVDRHVGSYLTEKPLAEYLPAALAKLGIERLYHRV